MEDLQQWLEQRWEAAYATGWRPHGGVVGATVRLRLHPDDRPEIVFHHRDDSDAGCDTIIWDGALGTITEIGWFDGVSAKFAVKLKYDDREEFSELVIHLCAVGYGMDPHPDDAIWCEVLGKPHGKQLSLFAAVQL